MSATASMPIVLMGRHDVKSGQELGLQTPKWQP